MRVRAGEQHLKKKKKKKKQTTTYPFLHTNTCVQIALTMNSEPVIMIQRWLVFFSGISSKIKWIYAQFSRQSIDQITYHTKQVMDVWNLWGLINWIGFHIESTQTFLNHQNPAKKINNLQNKKWKNEWKKVRKRKTRKKANTKSKTHIHSLYVKIVNLRESSIPSVHSIG